MLRICGCVWGLREAPAPPSRWLCNRRQPWLECSSVECFSLWIASNISYRPFVRCWHVRMSMDKLKPKLDEADLLYPTISKYSNEQRLLERRIQGPGMNYFHAGPQQPLEWP